MHLRPELLQVVLWKRIKAFHPTGEDIHVEHQNAIAKPFGHGVRFIAESSASVPDGKYIPDLLEIIDDHHHRLQALRAQSGPPNGSAIDRMKRPAYRRGII